MHSQTQVAHLIEQFITAECLSQVICLNTNKNKAELHHHTLKDVIFILKNSQILSLCNLHKKVISSLSNTQEGTNS